MVKLFTLLITLLTVTTSFAATGEILYQNCYQSGSCSAGTTSNNGWNRAVVSSGCYSGSCLKLNGTQNTNTAALAAGIYGAGSTNISTGTVLRGKKEITISQWVKFSEASISGANMKIFIPYVTSTNRWGVLIVPNYAAGKDIYLSSVRPNRFTKTPLFSPTINSAYSTGPDSNGEYWSDGRLIAGNTNSPAVKPGATWFKLTAYLRLPTTGSSTNGVFKLWMDNQLLFDAFDIGMDNPDDVNNPDFHTLTFYSSSEAKEPFEHWMDEMVIYEGYVPPDGSDPPPEQVTCYPDFDNDLYPGEGSQNGEICPTNYYIENHFNEMTLDCDDNDPAINPGEEEICGNDVDEDCSGLANLCPEDLECSSISFNLCDETQCSALGLYPWGGTCNTVVQPVSIVSNNLILNSNLADWTSVLPNNYTSYQSSGISKSVFGANMVDGSTLNPLYFLSPSTSYIAVYNLMRVNEGSSKLWSYGFASDTVSSTPGTIVHEFTTPSTMNDTKIYIGASSDSNVEINNIRLYTTTELSCTDADGDGYSIEGGLCGTIDCDDTNAAINPGETEICGDGIDNNCSGSDAVCGAAPAAGIFWEYKNAEGNIYVPTVE